MAESFFSTLKLDLPYHLAYPCCREERVLRVHRPYSCIDSGIFVAVGPRGAPAVARPAQAGSDAVAFEHVGIRLGRVLGEFRLSSQHHVRSCDASTIETTVGSWGPTQDAFPRSADCCKARASAALLGCHRSRTLSSEDAAVAAGVSPPVGSRWLRQSGGMPPITYASISGRYLSFPEREEIAILKARALGVREIARQLGRSASTISENCVAMLQLEAETCSTAPPLRNGMLTGKPGGRSQRSSVSMSL